MFYPYVEEASDEHLTVIERAPYQKILRIGIIVNEIQDYKQNHTSASIIGRCFYGLTKDYSLKVDIFDSRKYERP